MSPLETVPLPPSLLLDMPLFLPFSLIALFNFAMFSNSRSVCDACQLGCHVRLPFSSSKTRTTRPFELIHYDLWTSPVLSTSGFKYFLVILDDFTDFLWTVPLRQKYDAYA
jgi:hypothetical protein